MHAPGSDQGTEGMTRGVMHRAPFCRYHPTRERFQQPQAVTQQPDWDVR